MSEPVDEQFEDILQEALRQAASVACDSETYRLNLRSWIDTIRTEIRASEETNAN